MKRILVAACLAVISAPALAQPANEELKAFVGKYFEAFNKGDATALARDFYALPNVEPADLAAKLDRQFQALRADSFGKVTIYGSKSCVHGAVSAEVQVDFAYNYTFGGVMDPPGDQSTVFRLRKTGEGWRIVASNDLQGGQSIVCAL